MKRNRNEIISEILRICIKGARKTKVVYQANLMKAIDQVHSTLAEYQDSLPTPTSA